MIIFEALMVDKDIFFMDFLLLFIPFINSESLQNLVFRTTDPQDSNFRKEFALVVLGNMLIGLAGFGLEPSVLLLHHDFLVLFKLSLKP